MLGFKFNDNDKKSGVVVIKNQPGYQFRIVDIF